MKMLIIEVFNIGKSNMDKIRIASQPFTGGQLYSGDCEFHASNGFSLYSSGSPEVQRNSLYLRGCYENNHDTVMVVPNKEWLEKLSQAVREYNNYLEDTGGLRKAHQREIGRITPNMQFLESLFTVEEVIR